MLRRVIIVATLNRPRSSAKDTCVSGRSKFG